MNKIVDYLVFPGVGLLLWGYYLINRLNGIKLIFGLVVFVIGFLTIMFSLFFKPISSRVRHFTMTRKLSKESDFRTIDKYNSNLNYKATYFDRIMYINHFYRDNYYQEKGTGNLVVKDISKRDFENLSKRQVFLEERVRDNGLYNSFVEMLILTIFIQFVTKDAQGNDFNPLTCFVISATVCSVYYIIVRMLDKQNETELLNNYEIEQIKKLYEGVDTPHDNKNWKNKMMEQSKNSSKTE